MVGPEAGLSKLERLRGLLLGGAAGDALGAPVEFMNRAEILKQFGPRGITEFAPAFGRLSAITDDTQMTMFTLEGLIRADVRWTAKGICNPVAVIGHAYRRWRATQTPTMIKSHTLDGWLIGLPELWSQRAPQRTCMTALANKPEVWTSAQNHSKGSSAIVRMGPIGLVDAHRPYQLACEAAALTHGHPTAITAAGWFASWIQLIAEGLTVDAAARRAAEQHRGEAPELDRALGAAFRLAAAPASQAPEELGHGWVADEAAAMAVWCVLAEPEPMEALRLAVNIDGDSDTVGSLVGQVLGAFHGPGWVPNHWLAQLELRQAIEQLATDAAWMFWGDVDSDSDAFAAFWERYPGW